ncbi:unnamed protein product [Litomosoides sigmodontis]|uniref:ShKT domain-containing protein n=1 Tax=Litomosoides sigmodontis TaxID=42156 RepID=A0A3P6SC41_LITSI|nr:unnamed protein product [Litomosoides sigmodontis]
MQELVWDQQLGNLAYDHAKRCDAWHRSAYERQGHGYSHIGESIWWSNEAYLRSNLQSAMLDFFNERPYYDYTTNKCMLGAQCAHYTQYVWGETCAIGCAAVHCSGIKNGNGVNKGHIIICNYGESGNQYGKRPYLLGPRCSNCRCGGKCTSEGLCPPCCTGIRYLQHGTFIPLSSASSRAQMFRKLWRDKGSAQQKQKNYQQKGNSKLYSYECQDLEPYCDYWAENVGCYSKHRNFMMKHCPATCNWEIITCKMDFGFSLQMFPKWLESLLQKLSDVIFKYPGPAVMSALIFCISYVIFKKIIDPQLYEYYKSTLRYEDTLQLLKDELEENYEEYHWNNPQFCKAYLALYAAYRELRMMAKRNFQGEIDPNDRRWIQFDHIKTLQR